MTRSSAVRVELPRTRYREVPRTPLLGTSVNMLVAGLLTAEEKLMLFVANQEPTPLVCEDGFLRGLSARLFARPGGDHIARSAHLSYQRTFAFVALALRRWASSGWAPPRAGARSM